MTEVNNIDECNEILDRIMLEWFETVTHLEEYRTRLHSQFENGCLQLARSRYYMGNKNVTSLQYQSNDNEEPTHPLVKCLVETCTERVFSTSKKTEQLKISKSTDHHSNVENNQNETSVMYDWKAIKLVYNTDKISLKDSSLETREKNELRKRHTMDSSEDTLDEDYSRADDGKSSRSSSSVDKNDPLNWFGILVPHTLRNAQTMFSSCIQDAITVATYQSKLIDLSILYKKVVKRKEILMASSS